MPTHVWLASLSDRKHALSPPAHVLEGAGGTQMLAGMSVHIHRCLVACPYRGTGTYALASSASFSRSAQTAGHYALK